MKLRLLLSVLLIVSGLMSGSSHALAEPPDCSDAIDNDGDGLTDFPDDPGCMDAIDDDEANPAPQCSDGVDNDNNGLTDFPDDPDCDSPEDVAEGYTCGSYYSTEASSSYGCFPANLTIRFDRELHAFKGAVASPRRDCFRAREIVVRRSRPGPDPALGSVLSSRRGLWRLPMSGYVKGRFYATAAPTTLQAASGATVECPGDRSVTIRIRARD
jgi:hypothetical protein